MPLRLSLVNERRGVYSTGDEPSFSGCEPANQDKSSQVFSSPTPFHAATLPADTFTPQSVSQSVSSRRPPRSPSQGTAPLPSVNTSTRLPVLSTRSLGLQPTPRCRPSSVNSEVFSLRKRTDSDARASAYYMYMYKKNFHLAAAGVSRLYEKPRSMKSAQHWAVATRSRTNRFSSFDGKLWWRSEKPH